MTINRLNYEKFAIDYIDGTLSPDLRDEMAAFLNAHPDIKEEVEWQQDFTPPQLPELLYPGKEKLIRPVAVVHRLRTGHWLAIAASFLLLLAFALGYWQHQDKVQMAQEETPIKQPGQPLAENTTPPAETSGADDPVSTQQAATPPPGFGKEAESPTEKSILQLPPPAATQVVHQVKSVAPAEVDELQHPEETPWVEPEPSVAQNIPVPVEANPETTPKEVTRELAFATLPVPLSDKIPVIDTLAVTEPAVALRAPVKQPESRNRLGIFKRILRPEAFSDEESFSIKESVIPEAYAAIFSKD